MKGLVWTDEVIDKLRRLADKNMTINEIARELHTHRDKVIEKAKELGITLTKMKHSWNLEAVETLRKQAENFTQKQLAKMYGISEDAIYKVLSSNNITPVPDLTTREKWSEEEIETLKSLAPNLYVDEISPIVHKSIQRIMTMAKNLGIEVIVRESYVPWTEEDIAKLREYSKIHYSDEIAFLLNRNEHDIRIKAKELNINLIYRSMRFWDANEVSTLVECAHQRIPFDIIARKLNRSNRSVYEKMDRLGLLELYKEDSWNELDIALLKIFSSDFTVTQLSNLFEKSVESVKYKLKRFNLPSLQAEEMDTSTNINNILDNKRHLLEMERQALLDHKDTLEKAEDKQL